MNNCSRKQLIKKLFYQSYNRGCKEADLLLGNFARQNLTKMTNKELEIFARLLQLPDSDIYGWYSGKKPLSEENINPVMDRLLNFTLAKQ